MRKMLPLLCALIATLMCTVATAQEATGERRMRRGQRGERPVAEKKTATLGEKSADSLYWRSIGPSVMGGRITSLAVNESDPSMWWAATATGGLLKTINNGITFEYQFQNEAVSSIGDVAVSQSNPDIVWVGTGEANPRNSVSWGKGVYKSVDGGKTWQNMGLKKTFQISSVRIHPTNPDIVYVGALGRLWGPNEDRGLYKTVDGGVNWEKIHYIDEETGVIDLQMHPTDPETLLVATYVRRRDGFDGNSPIMRWGEGAGLFKTTDGGKTFTRITKGMPTAKIGRIGLEYYRKDPNTVYMVMETEKLGKEPANAPYLGVIGTNADVGAKITTVVKDGPAAEAGFEVDDIVLRINDKTVQTYNGLIAECRRIGAGNKVALEISRNRKSIIIEVELANKPKRGAASGGARRGRGGRGGETRNPFQARLNGQNANLQGQQGGEGEHEYGGVYKSTNGGESWTRINSVNPRPMYFSEIRTDPSDDSHLWVAGVQMHKSKDGGETFTPDGHPGSVHVDHHALWIDPKDGRHMILGNDGGIYVTHDRGINWDHLNHVAIGQFYHVTVGPRRNYRVYGGLQDNGSWGGPNRVRNDRGPVNGDWFRIGGGDGFVCRVDADDPDQLYYESQNGGMGRRNLRTGSRGSNRPRAPRRTAGARGQRGGERGARAQRGTRESYRFNWRTPFILSSHNSKIFYTAGNKVFRSYNKGERMEAISPNITASKKGSATALAESPVDPKVLYVGTDDGALWRTIDGGHNWDNLFPMTMEEIAKSKESKKEEKVVSETGEEKPTVEKPKEGMRRRGGPNGRRRGARRAPRESNFAAFVPGRRWVSEIVASKYRAGRVFVTLDGHRSDDDSLYVLKSEDYGMTWEPIINNLPPEAGSTRTIAEDITNSNVLYLGCEFGAYVSLDRGQSWTRMNSNLPTVPVHAFAQHKESGELIAGTHGRSIWICDVSGLRQVTAESLGADSFLYTPNEAIQWRREPNRGSTIRRFVGENPRSGASIYYSLGKKARSCVIKIKDMSGKELASLDGKLEKGFHAHNWNLRGSAPATLPDGRPVPARFRGRMGRPVGAGTYLVDLIVDGKSSQKQLKVALDPEQKTDNWLEAEYEAELEEMMRGDEEEEGEQDDDETDVVF